MKNNVIIVFVSTQEWAPKEQRDSDSLESLCENKEKCFGAKMKNDWEGQGTVVLGVKHISKKSIIKIFHYTNTFHYMLTNK